MNLSYKSRLVLRRLRPPFARSALLLYPFTWEGRFNQGITVELPANEPVISPGDGIVKKIYSEYPFWQTTRTDVQKTSLFSVIIDHGERVESYLAGLNSVDVHIGQRIERGDKIGAVPSKQLFIAVAVNNKGVNPIRLNYHWLPQNGNIVTGQSRKIRFAPDKIYRDISAGVKAILNAGIKYFIPDIVFDPFLINIDFNGNGNKQGLAVEGFSPNDYWNVYIPDDFSLLQASTCYYYYAGYGFYTFTANPILRLKDYQEQDTPIIFERIANLVSAAGSAASWDEMLKTWVGGYLAGIPYENAFRIRNLPKGNYRLILFANQGTLPNTSTFYASAGLDIPASQTLTTTSTPEFIMGANYAQFDLTINTHRYITFKSIGYLCGLQLIRL